MEELVILKDLVIICAASVFTIALLQKFKIPIIAGFILAGILTGPHTFGLIKYSSEINAISEIGVILLLFGIGLELSLDRIRRLLLPILIGGGLQVFLTGAIAALLAGIIGYPTTSSLFFGFIVAVSSTAVVLRAFQDRGEIDTPHGRLTVGILLFQDICVVPFIFMIPILAGISGPEISSSVFELLSLSTVIIVGLILASTFLVPRILDWAAKTRQKELFLMTVFLICIVTAWLISFAGVKLALGAFFAGVIVAGSRFKHQALAEIIPFRAIFTSVFFVSIGMLLDIRQMLENAALVALLVGTIIIGKFLVVLVVGAIMRLPFRYSVISAASLSQIGEFSFVLIKGAEGTGLLPQQLSLAISSAAVITMLITPLMLLYGPKLATGASRIRILTGRMGIPVCCDAEQSKLEKHIIIVGYGLTGRKVARELHDIGIPYVIVDLNPDNVRSGASENEPIYLGDARDSEILLLLNIPEAKEIVISINDPVGINNVIRAARKIAPEIYIIASIKHFIDKEAAITAGADELIVAEEEAANSISRVISSRHKTH